MKTLVIRDSADLPETIDLCWRGVDERGERWESPVWGNCKNDAALQLIIADMRAHGYEFDTCDERHTTNTRASHAQMVIERNTMSTTPEINKLKYRVVWRELRSSEWQIRDFGTDQQAARRFHRQCQDAFKASIVKWWSEAEQLWIG